MDLMGGTEKDGYNLSPFTFERAGKAILGSWVASRYNLPRRVALGECWNAGTPETKAARLCSNTASFVLRLPEFCLWQTACTSTISSPVLPL